MEQTEPAVRPKHYAFEKPTITAVFTQTENGVEIAVSSDCFAKAVEIVFNGIDCGLSENFFDITGETPHRIFAQTHVSAAHLERSLIIRSVYDIG